MRHAKGPAEGVTNGVTGAEATTCTGAGHGEPHSDLAFEARHAPRVVLRATHEAALAYCSLADLKRFAVDLA